MQEPKCLQCLGKERRAAPSGINPQNLRGTRTGVFVGSSGSESIAALTQDPELVSGYSMNGCAQSMFANRLSYTFDFRGPSFAVDTACNSSLLAFQLAVTALREGQCTAALVCGANATLTPTNALQFTRLGVTTPEGTCKSFDASGTGYAKSEGIGALLLQRSSVAHRIYCTVVHAKSNTDGYKEAGITFPSGERQAELLREVYAEAGVDPASVAYIEAHGTGTKVGDPQEANALTDVFLQHRDSPLLIGSVKSNMGHAEPASGVASLAKVIIAIQEGQIPPNLHFKEPNPYIPALLDGRLKVVAEATPWEGGFVGINSFGFGGANTHVLIKSHDPPPSTPPPPIVTSADIPRLVCYCGRVPDGLEGVLDAVEQHKDNEHFLALLGEQSNIPTKLMPYRGYAVLKEDGETVREVQKVPVYERRPVYFIFSGMGTQWPGMGRDLMDVPVFRKSILDSSEVLRNLGCDPYSLLMRSDKDVFKNVRNSIVCNIAIQLALTDTLRELGVEPDGIIGHSTGEISCGYADGCLTREQAMLLAYHRGDTILNAEFGPGAMAAVGLTWEEALEKLPEGVVAACHNGKDSVSISGEEPKVLAFVEEMKADGVFAKAVDSSGIAFHSPCMKGIEEKLIQKFSEIIPSPRPRSERWISSSIADADAQAALAATCSAQYNVNNITSPVLFYEALQLVPENAVTVEIAPHALLQAILRRTLDSSCTNIGLMKKAHEKQVDFLLCAIGKIYSAGVDLDFGALYPRVKYPVPRGTPMIGSLMRWDHSQSYTVISGVGAADASGSTVTVDPFDTENDEHKFLLDHTIDGRALYPFTGYPVMAWKALCKVHKLNMETTGAVFEEICVHRPTFLSKAVKFQLVLSPGSGDFEVIEGETVAASGKIQLIDGDKPFFYEKIKPSEEVEGDESMKLTTPDVYKEFLIRGYEYGPHFRGIHNFNLSGSKGQLLWNDNWVTFLDTLLQTTILQQRAEALRLPIRLRYLRVDAQRMAKAVQTLEDGTKVVDVQTHSITNGLLAGGAEMRDLTVQTASRRMHHLELYMERVEFIPHKDSLCLKDYPVAQQTLRKYGEMCRKVAKETVQSWGTETLAKMPQGAFLKEAFASDLADPVIDALNLTPEEIDNPKHGILRILHQLCNLDLNTPDFLANAQNIVKTNYHTLLDDKMYCGAFTTRCLKPFMDIVVENSATHLKNCAELEPAGKAASTLRWYMQSHPQVETDWKMVGPGLGKEGEGDDDYPALDLNVEAGDELPDDEKPFDVVVLEKVLSKKTDPVRYLQNAKKLLTETGFAIVFEIEGGDPISLLLDSLAGVGESSGGDGSRVFGRYFTQERLQTIFEEAGFRLIGWQTDPAIVGTVYLVRNIPSAVPSPTFVDMDDIKEFSWIEPLQKAIEERLHEPENKTIWMTNTDIRDNGVVGITNCFREEYLSQNRFRCITDISLNSETEKLDLESEDVKSRMREDLHQNCYRDGVWGSIRGINMKEEHSHAYGLVQHAYITNLVQGDLSSITWVESPGPLPQAEDPYNRTGTCHIYYASLNFRDIMLATGRLSADAIPGNFSERDCVLGVEYSGKTADGRRMMGMINAQALATEVQVEFAKHCWDVPDHWTMEEAATVPVVYMTAYQALLVRGRMRRGEKVLIHSGSGGVGQAAIAIALGHGCEVFTTVSNQEKKSFLQKRFPQLQDKHFSNSRTLDFEWDILERTNGKGVDIVLNSLAEDKLQASLRCLGNFGRFLEIGKVDIAKNSKIGMEILIKNIEVHGIVLDGILDEDDWRTQVDLLQDGIDSGVVQPLYRTVFPSDKAEDAFRFMTTGKHIGKVLIQIRPEEADKTAPPQPIQVKAVRRSYCNPEHVYLITGGLGGFGLELAQWLTTKGATKLVLTSRSGVKTGYQARTLKLWKQKGISVKISSLDISDEVQAHQLIKECLEDGPLGGLFHLAMVLRDSLFENQVPENFQDSAAAKYWGTKYLDDATRKLCGPELRWFVAFSSIASGRGNNGQTAYGWANSTMERVMEQRTKDGLTGMAVQWGAIGDVGVILQNMGDNSTVVGGTLPQRLPSCFQVLDTFISWNIPIVCSYVRAETGRRAGGAGGANILEAVAKILGVTDLSTIDPDTHLVDLGLDSLMGMEIKQAIERDNGIALSMKEIQNMTLNKLKKLSSSGGVDSSKASTGSSETSKEDLKQQMFQLFRLRIDANELLSTERIVPINDVKDGKPVFFVHTMEGVAGPLRALGAQLTVPAYCFQCIPGAPLETIESLSAHYIEIMKDIQPTGPYRLVGYSYGAGLAFEMATQLQAAAPEGVETVESLILMDGSHHYMKAYRDMYRLVYGVATQDLVGHPLFESELVLGMVMRFANCNFAELREKLLAQENWDKRVEVATEKVMEGGLFDKPDTFRWICTAVRGRFLAGDKYVPQRKFLGDLHLIRAEHGAAKEEDVGKDYGLGEVTDGKVNVQIAEGDHESFVQGDNAVKTAARLMDIFCR